MAAKLRGELNTEVDLVHGKYGEFKVLLDGNEVVNAGPLIAYGIGPSVKDIVAAVRKRLEPVGT